ncbi:MAG: HAD superfamily hydrolase (TIGR01450 family) [Candidatus Aldehydirespiratoraceae bacterium]|jgi:HAD superfamily hydrolase (TIGR01450 family)
MGSQLTAWAIDLDGVIWRGVETVPGAPEAIAALRDRGTPIAFVTNSAARTPAQVAEKLAFHGIPDAEDLVITSAMAAASMIDPSAAVFIIGGDGLRQAIVERGASLVRGPEADTVVVGISPEFDYAMLAEAMRAIRSGARFIATNDDTTFPDSAGLLPGNGALVAAVAACSEVAPEIAGKPHEPIAAFVRDRLGSSGVMVGDRPETDGLFASSVGYDFALVLSGVIGAEDLPVVPAPRFVAADILSLLEQLG